MTSTDARVTSGMAAKLFLVFGLTAPIITFAIAVSGLSVEAKVGLVVAVAVVNTVLFLASRKTFSAEYATSPVSISLPAEEVPVDTLTALEEAGRFFNASSDQREMFDLVVERVREVFPFEAAALFRPSPSGETMELVQSSFEVDSDDVLPRLEYENCLSGIAFLSGEIEIDRDLAIESSVFGNDVPENSAVAIPLSYEGRVLAVFEMFASTPIENEAEEMPKLELVREHITPLFLASFAADKSISGALTDTVTEIPNARAFQMVLENQIAESQRFRDERPLTVLAIDLKSFRVVNQQYGHATGDAILSIAAARIRGQLRKMDFLSRFEDDEFVAVLPLVDEKFVDEVVTRIRNAFKESKFRVGDLEFAIELNIGSACFWQDGETPQQLIQQAQLRKQHAKAVDPSNVVLFPKEYVN